MRHPHPATPARTSSASGQITLHLIGLDRITDMLEVSRAELDDIVAGADFPAPFVDGAAGATSRRLWTDLSIVLYRLRRDSTLDLVRA